MEVSISNIFNFLPHCTEIHWLANDKTVIWSNIICDRPGEEALVVFLFQILKQD